MLLGSMDTNSFQAIPTGDQFHRAVADLAILYHRDFGVSFPPINSPLLLFSYVKQLALPRKKQFKLPTFSAQSSLIHHLVEVYPAVRHLQNALGDTSAFPQSIVGRFRPAYLPEVQLMSLLVIITKLFFPIDDIKRYPYSWKDPAAQVMDWDSWIRAQKEFDEKGRRGETLGKGEAISISESDALDMIPKQLDDYMDWYEKMWIDGQSETPRIP